MLIYQNSFKKKKKKKNGNIVEWKSVETSSSTYSVYLYVPFEIIAFIDQRQRFLTAAINDMRNRELHKFFEITYVRNYANFRNFRILMEEKSFTMTLERKLEKLIGNSTIPIGIIFTINEIFSNLYGREYQIKMKKCNEMILFIYNSLENSCIKN